MSSKKNYENSEISGDISNDEDGISSPIEILKKLKMKNISRTLIAQLNVNSIRNKFEQLKLIVNKNIDILVITETKIDNSYPSSQFEIDGFNIPFRLNRDEHGGGILIYVKENIPCKLLKNHGLISNFEGIFFEINLGKNKWLIFGGYNPKKENIEYFLDTLSSNLNNKLDKYDSFLLIGDFNSQITEKDIEYFCKIYNLCNLIKEPTCYKNPNNPSSIDLMLTNKSRSFHGSTTVETGLSDIIR